MSNLAKRLLTAFIGIPIVAVLTYLGGWWFVGMVGLLMAGAQFEFYRMLSPRITWWHAGVGILLGALVVLHQYLSLNLQPLVLLILITLIVFDTFKTSLQESWSNLAWMVAGVLYPAWLFSFAVNLRLGWGDALTQLECVQLIVGLLVIVWATDSLAYFTGRTIGKTPFAPKISPKKTWEGTIGGFLGAVAAAVLLKLFVLAFLSWQDALVCAAIGGIGGQIGDLAESRLKRIFGVKDSGTILPGHGGILDRIDGLILVMPLYYLYLQYFGAF